MRSRTILFFMILAISFAPALWADDQTQQEDQNSPAYQVTVTADRLEEPVSETSDSITVITHDQIEAHQWNYVIDALRQVPGLTILQTGSPGKVTSTFLRGASQTQMMVMIDGIPVNNPYFGGVDFENLTTDNIERIEVLKGPQSPLYGSDSMAGVVQIITRKGSGPARVHAAFEGGMFQTYRENLAVTGGTDAVDYSMSYSRQDSDGQVDNDEFRENVFSSQAGIKINDSTRLNLTGHVYDAHTGIPFDFSFQPAPLQNQDSDLWLIGASLLHHHGDYLNLNTTLTYNNRDFHFENTTDAFTPLTNNNSHIIRLDLQNDFHITAQDTFTAGYEFEHQSINADDQNGPYLDEVIQNNGLFAQNKWESAKYILAAGIRYDHFNSFGNTVNPRISGAYKVSENNKIRASFGTGFRAPTAGDLALPFYGNPDLKPEKSQSFEIGYDQYRVHDIDFSVSYFHNHFDDLITFNPITFLAANIAKAKTQGVEVSASYGMGGWSFWTSYTYLDTEDELTGLRLPRRPKNSGNFRVSYEASKWGVSTSFLGMGDRLETDFSVFPSVNVLNPGFGKLDVAAHYRILDSLNIKARVENLTDKDYQEILGYPSPGIAFYGGIEATF